MYKFDENTLIIPYKKNLYRFYHTVTRANFISDIKFFLFINFLKKKNIDKIDKIEKYISKNKIFLIDCTKFTLWRNMYENADMFSIKKKIKKKSFLEFLTKNKYIHKKKINYFFKKKNIFDFHAGNLNQKLLGQSIIKRISITKWWFDQKFKNINSLKNTPYKSIQESFLKKYFQENIQNKKVLDIGCGTGHYTIQMSKYAKKISAFDINKNYIEMAKLIVKKKKINNIKFFCEDIVKFKSTDKFDFIFLIDVFLFFFDKNYQEKLSEKTTSFFSKLKKLLTKNGKIFICDPHLFWLTPIFGEKKLPYGVINEYNSKLFSTSYTLQQASDVFFKNRLKINRILEPKVPIHLSTNNKRYKFFSQFPQWVVFELIK